MDYERKYKLIDKAAVVAEIERIKNAENENINSFEQHRNTSEKQRYNARMALLEHILSFLDTLEVKENNMDYEKRCKELVEAIKQLQETNPSDGGIQNWANEVLYETKEAENERIRKALIAFIKKRDRSGCDYDYDKWIAWLEKQGKTSPVLSNSLNIGKMEIKENEKKISPKWSKEDEEEFKIAIETLHEAGQHSSARWLKSIKQRLEEQQ